MDRSEHGLPLSDKALSILAHKKKPAKVIYTYADVPSVWDFEATVTWLIDGLLPEGAVTLISGDSGSGKTLFCTAMAGAVITGEPFLGLPVEQRRVLYLDRENSIAVTRQHLFDLRISRTPALTVWGTWCEHPPDGPAAVSLHEFAKDEKPVIFFDSLISFHNGDESDASETRRYLHHFRTLASAGATIVVLHHTGKSDGAKQYRGSSDIKAAVDVAYLLEKLGDPAGLLTELRLVAFKNRIGAGQTYSLAFDHGQFRSHQRRETTRETIERLVRQHPNSTYDELRTHARAAGLSKHQAEDEIAKGLRDGRFEARRIGRRVLHSIREADLGEM
jgi:RecA-family ATPase